MNQQRVLKGLRSRLGPLVLVLTSTVTLLAVGSTPANADQVPWTPSPTQAPLPTATLPDGGTAHTMDLLSTSCSSSEFCVAVGWVKDATDATFPVAETYSGGTWNPSLLPMPSDATTNRYDGVLSSVSCAVDGSCAATGNYLSFNSSNNSSYQVGLLEQLTWGVWTATAAALPSGPDSGLFNLNSVSCSDAATCVAVGSGDDFVTGSSVALIYTLNAGAWQLQVTPNPANTNGINVTGVSCPDEGDCAAVGYYQDTSYNWHALIYTLTSGVWTSAVAPVPANLGTGNQPNIELETVDCPEVGSCVAGGFYEDANGHMDPLLLQEGSGTWTPIEAPVPSDSQSDTLAAISGVYCPAVGSCVATGYYWTAWPTSESGLTLTQLGGSWTAASAPLPDQNAPAPRSANVVASPGVVATVQSPPGTNSLTGVGCSVDGFCAAAGAENSGGLLESGALFGLPSVSGVSPAQGPVAGGTPVTITGANFGFDSVASFGGTPVATTVVSTTDLQAIAPSSAAAAAVDVTVTTGGLDSRANKADLFSYTGVQQRVAGYTRSNTSSNAQSADATFTLPSVICTGLPKVWGARSVDEGAMLSTTAGETIGGVVLSCVGQTASYTVLLEVNGAVVRPTFVVMAGQVVTVSASESTKGTTVTVTNGTMTQTATGAGQTVTGESLGALAADCTISNCASVPRTSPTAFSAVSIDGRAPFGAGATLVKLEDAAGQIEMVAGDVNRTALRTRWEYSCSTTTSC